MPYQPIPQSKGAFVTTDEHHLRNSEFSTRMVNLLTTPSGAVIDRPSLKAFSTLSSTDIIGLNFFDGKIVAVARDRKIFSIDSDGTSAQLPGVTLPGVGRPIFAKDRNALYIVGGGQPVRWKGGNQDVEILPGIPPNGTHIVFLDDFLVMNAIDSATMNTQFAFSALADPEDWPGANFSTANAGPDPIVAITVNQRELFLFGDDTIEVWNNIGTGELPFIRVFAFQFGTPSPYSPIVVDGSTYFIDQDRRILSIAGRQVTPISQPIDNDLKRLTDVDNAISFFMPYLDKKLIVFVFPNDNKGWCFDVNQGDWSEWRGFEDGSFTRPDINSIFYAQEFKKSYAGSFSTGNLWELSDTEKTDAGIVFKRLRRSAFIDRGANIKKRGNRLDLAFKRGVATLHPTATTADANTSNPVCEIRWRGDDDLWTEWVQIDLGAIGDHDAFRTVFNLGIYRGRQYEIQMSDPVDFHLLSMHEDFDVLMR